MWAANRGTWIIDHWCTSPICDDSRTRTFTIITTNPVMLSGTNSCDSNLCDAGRCAGWKLGWAGQLATGPSRGRWEGSQCGRWCRWAPDLSTRRRAASSMYSPFFVTFSLGCLPFINSAPSLPIYHFLPTTDHARLMLLQWLFYIVHANKVNSYTQTTLCICFYF